MNCIKRQKYITPEDEPSRLEGGQCATGEGRRTSTKSSRKNEEARQRGKQCSVEDMSGGGKKSDGFSYCIGN